MSNYSTAAYPTNKTTALHFLSADDFDVGSLCGCGAGRELDARYAGQSRRCSAARSEDELLAGRFIGETFQCQFRTLSEVMREHNVERIDLLKIDVEKSELDVLNGIGPSEWKKIDQLVIRSS